MAMAARQNTLLSADNEYERCRETPSGGVPVTSPLTEPILPETSPESVTPKPTSNNTNPSRLMTHQLALCHQFHCLTKHYPMDINFANQNIKTTFLSQQIGNGTTKQDTRDPWAAPEASRRTLVHWLDIARKDMPLYSHISNRNIVPHDGTALCSSLPTARFFRPGV